MTVPPRADQVGASDTDDPFARLVQELQDLDYTRVETIAAGTVSHTMATASDLRATIERTGTPGRARLIALGEAGSHRFEVTCTADTPPSAQILLLYAVLLADAGDEQDVLRSIADALRVDLDTEPPHPAAPPPG